MPHRLPVLLAAPAAFPSPWAITNASVFDSATGATDPGQTIRIRDGRIESVGPTTANRLDTDPVTVVDAENRTVLPGLIDAHAHLNPTMPTLDHGVEMLRTGVRDHLLAAELRRTIAAGVTTVRDVGSYGDAVFTARQAMRYGAFTGPRVLTCGRIVSATAPGGRFFEGMYTEADGAEGMRRAAREQLRAGADFVKIMSTGARSVELEDPEPAQVTAEEMRALVDETHRLGYRVAAHSEGLAGTELAIRAQVDTIEHGMYLNQRPDLLDLMAENDQVLVPTLGCFYGVAGQPESIGPDAARPRDPAADPAQPETWTPLLRDLALHNLEQADRTLNAAHSAGVRIAAGHDWYPFDDLAVEVARLHHHGITGAEALQAATYSSAYAVGLHEHVGRIRPGLLADLLIVDGDPVGRPEILCDRRNIWLVTQSGTPVAGSQLPYLALS